MLLVDQSHQLLFRCLSSFVMNELKKSKTFSTTKGFANENDHAIEYDNDVEKVILSSKCERNAYFRF